MDLQELIALVTTVEARSKSNTRRLDRLEEETVTLHELAKNVAVLAESLKTQSATLQEVRTDVQQLKLVPARRWEQVVEKLIFGLIGTGLGAVLAQVLS